MTQAMDKSTKEDVQDYLKELDETLVSKHASMNEDRNPVFVAVRKNQFSRNQIESVLQQYSYLPRYIIDFLSAGKDRLHGYTNTTKELLRNINEEKGSRTGGVSHYEILRSGLQQEVRLDLNGLTQSGPTERFLTSISSGLADGSAPFVAGILYALEASAIPELTVVAHIVNAYASAKAIQRPIFKSPAQPPATNFLDLSLDTFFAMHLHDFEVGHRDGLITSLSKDEGLTENLPQFEKGFEYTLDAMDSWWAALASTSSEAN